MVAAAPVRALPPNVRIVPYLPKGAARELFLRRDPEVVLSGPAGTGKTRASLQKVHAAMAKYSGARSLILRKTRESLTQSALVTFEKHVIQPEGSLTLHHESQEYRFGNGSVIVVGGMDKSSRIMSTEYDLIYVPECTELTEDEWEVLLTRLRNGVMPYQQLLADCNPDAPHHWVMQRANRGQLTMLESRHEDNPTVTADYLSRLDQLTGVRYKRLRLGQWVAAEGQVWEEWDRAVHLIDPKPIPASWPRIVTVDFGYTHPFVAQWWARDPDGRLYRYREIHMRQRLVEDHAKQMAHYLKAEPWPSQIIADWDAEDRATLERHLAINTGRRVAVTKAIKNVSAGIQSVAERLRKAGDGRPRIFLLRGALVERDPLADELKQPACTEEEIESYVWDLGMGRRKGEEPLKVNDDGCDTMRYACAAADLTSKGAPQMARFG